MVAVRGKEGGIVTELGGCEAFGGAVQLQFR